MRVLEIVIRLGETTLDHRFEAAATTAAGIDLDPTQLGPEWSHFKRGLAEVSARSTEAPTKHALGASIASRAAGYHYVAVSLAAHLVLWGVATEQPPAITVRIDPPIPMARIASATAVRGAYAEVGAGDTRDGERPPSMTLASMARSQGATRNGVGSVRPAEITKEEAIERARAAGILGAAVLDQLGTGGTGYSIDTIDAAATIYGPLLGASGEGFGSAGVGRTGVGSTGLHSDGTIIATGRYSTLSGGRGAGERSPARVSRGPMVFPCAGPKPCMVATGGLDKAVIRRYIQRQLPKFQYCYERELLGNPALQGTVETRFLIQHDGRVSSVEANGMSAVISSCVAGVIANIEFPKQRAGISDVRYPFTFRSAGS